MFKFYKQWFRVDSHKTLPFIVPDTKYADVEIDDNFICMMDEIFLCLSVYGHRKECPDDWPPNKVKVQLENLLFSLEGLGEDAFGMLPPDAGQSVDTLKKSAAWGLELIAMHKTPRQGGHNKIAEPDVDLIADMAGIYERFFITEPTPNQSNFVKFLDHVCNGCSTERDFSYTKRSRAAGVEKYLKSKK